MKRWGMLALLLLSSIYGSIPAREAVLATCSPQIVLDVVPPLGSSQRLAGHVRCVTPGDYVVAVYIQVAGGWWTKPTWANPLTIIASDSTWNTNIVTGGQDAQASQVAAFLAPKEAVVPKLLGQAVLPPELYTLAVAHTTVLRSINFSGFTWEVKSSPGPVGPGPNYFSNDPGSVSVDAQGYLHLKIVQRGGIWYSSEIVNTSRAGYGKHRIVIDSGVDTLDPNAVLGFFTWDTNAPQHHYREIDIEFARWGDPGGPNTQYVIQPYTVAAQLHRFWLAPPSAGSSHLFDWTPGHVSFFSIGQDETTFLHQWEYSAPGSIPPAGGNVRLNLWLMSGLPPTNGLDAEVVIRQYDFSPLPLTDRIYLPMMHRNP